MNDIFERLKRGLTVLGVAVLSGLCGVGAVYVVMAMIAISRSKNKNDPLTFVATHVSILVAGGMAGFLAGFVASLLVVKAGVKAENEMEKKYMHPGDRVRIYSGVPFFFISLLVPEFERLAHTVGERAAPYVGLGICLLIIAASLILFDHIPRSFVIPLGLLGWVLIFVAACWYYWFGPGAFGQVHAALPSARVLQSRRCLPPAVADLTS